MAYLLLFFVMLLGGVIALVESRRAREKAYFIWLLFAIPVLILFAGLRQVGVDHDTPLYLGWYQAVVAGNFDNGELIKDPVFPILCLVLNYIGLRFTGVLITTAGLSLIGQFTFAKKVFDPRWLGLGFFLILCRFYIPQEMTEIRVSIAIPLLSLAIYYLARRQLWLGAFLYLLAVACHISVLVALPLCLAIGFGVTFESGLWLACAPVVAVVGSVLFTRYGGIFLLLGRTKDYLSDDTDIQSSSIFTIGFLTRLLTLLFIRVMLWKKLNAQQRIIVICSTLAALFEATFVSNSTFALRSAELFGLFDVAAALLIIPYLRRWALSVYVLLLFALGGLFFHPSLKIVEPYSLQISRE